MGLVRPFSFRQWVACGMMVAVLSNTAAPLGLCLCVGCHCENSISRLLPCAVVAEEDCCCTPPQTLPEEGCCGSPETPCSCSCGDTQNDNAVVPTMVLPAKQMKIVPSWSVVSVLPAGFTGVSRAFSLLGNRWALPPPHVPLHILLCVFLN